MEVKTYFSDTYEVLFQYLKHAQSRIIISLEWALHSEIYAILNKKIQNNIKLDIVLTKGQTNKKKLKQKIMKELKNNVFWINCEDYFSYHINGNFYIINDDIIFSSSDLNKPNKTITVVSGNKKIILNFINITFKKIYHHTLTIEDIKNELKKIAEYIISKNFKNIEFCLIKLYAVSESYGLCFILFDLQVKKYKEALEAINLYLMKFENAIVVYSKSSFEMDYQLKVLELKLEMISLEKEGFEKNFFF